MSHFVKQCDLGWGGTQKSVTIIRTIREYAQDVFRERNFLMSLVLLWS